MNKSKRVSILGCGWVGKALFNHLEADHIMQCLSKDIKTNDKENKYNCDVLVIAIPPREHYVEVLKETLVRVDALTQVILLSSISFYDGKTSVVEVEALIHEYHEGNVILRLGGLMGYDRIAGKYTAGKVLTSDSRTNYVHRDDVVGILSAIIEQEIENEVFDVIAPLQSMKKKIFSQNAKIFGFKETEFLHGDEIGKILSPTKICKSLNYTFIQEDVHTFWDT